MDDMRQRYRAPRRDYTTPPHQPHAAMPPAAVPETIKHAYQPPPAHHQPDSVTSPLAEPHHRPQPTNHRYKKPKRRKLRRVLLTLTILIILVAGGGLWARSHYADANPFPADIQAKSGGLSLFYPKKLPAGYVIAPSSIHLANGVLVYAANNGDRRLVFTLQKVPAAFDFNSFYSQQVKNSTSYDTPYGQAIIGTNDNRSLASLTSNKTWFILSTNSPNVSQDDMSLVMRNLKKY